MIKTNQAINCKKCKGNDDVVLVANDKDKKTARKGYHGKHLNTDFAWDRNFLSQADINSTSLDRQGRGCKVSQ